MPVATGVEVPLATWRAGWGGEELRVAQSSGERRQGGRAGRGKAAALAQTQ